MILLRLLSASGLAAVAVATASGAFPVSQEFKDNVAQALPSEAYAQPTEARKLLVYTRTEGFRHSSIPVGVYALQAMGEKTGAYTIDHTEDPSAFQPASLAKYDAIVMLNTTGEVFQAIGDDGEVDAVHEALLAYVRTGGGLVGIHSATDTCYQWDTYGRLMGGYFDGHPWHEPVVIKLDEPDHPLNQMFHHQPLRITEEIYQLRDPYSRHSHRVLTSLDTDQTDMNKPGVKREDGDFAVTQVRTYGAGRVFYTSLGHREEIYWNPKILRHYLAGIQFAVGDLAAPSRPSKQGSTLASDWQPLLKDDLSGWVAFVPPSELKKLSRADALQKQLAANEALREHWTLDAGTLKFDGKGTSLATLREFGDFELKLDWKIEAEGDSGIYVRGVPQIQIWDNPIGSGGLYNNQKHPAKPLIKADKEPGEWNTFHITVVGDRVWVALNNHLVTNGVTLENYWNREQPLPARGPIVLQQHGTPLAFRNIAVRAPSRAALERAQASPEWATLFNGQSLDQWQFKDKSWKIEDGTLSRQGGGDVWTREQYGDFILTLEYKLDPGTNSGIFFRTGNLRDMVQTGIEVQVLDSHGKDQVGKHDAGAIYDIKAPSINAVKPPGEWNHCVVIAKGPEIHVTLNGHEVIDINLDNWTEPHQNPDGSRNKFNTAYKDMPRRGYIGFQDHGNPVWYRNVFVKPLAD